MDNFYTDLIGKKFQIGGRGPDTYDCYGLIIEMMKRLGKYLPEQDTPDGIEMRLKMFDEISGRFAEPIDKPEPFCMVVFDMGRLARLHIGVVLEDSRSFIHSAAYIKRVRIDTLSGILWKHKITGYYRCKKIKTLK